MLCYYACVLCFVFLLVLGKDSVAQQLTHPATDFSRHSLVQPTVHHGRTKREISSTRDTNGEHHSEVMISMEVDDEEYVLDLRLNQDLVTDNHVISYQDAGKTVVHRPKKEELELCQYSGTVRGKPDSRVAVSTCHGIRGVIFDDKRTKFIEPAGNDIKSFHYIYDDGDYITKHRCGSDDSINYTNNSSILKEYENENLQQIRANRYKRNAPRGTEVHVPYNANSKSRYVELVLVVDNEGYHAISNHRNMVRNQRIRKIHAQMKDIANVLNMVYSPLNIFIVLVGVEIWNEHDKIYLHSDSEVTLDNFLAYRRNKLVYDIPNDNAHLITRQKFNNGVVGKAYTRVMCTTQSSAGIANFHTDVLAVFAMTIAHEMGHNFGMDHDGSSDCKCPDDKCIMYPSTASEVRHFSSCSLLSLALTFEKGLDTCLRNKPERLFDSPTCGNGFVEAGEQCDCGLPDPSAHSACRACCHSDTCMLRDNATCGAGTCCDLQSCRPRAAGSVCRSAERECDLPEYCTGHSEFCPDDVHKMDTTPCGMNTAYCVRGRCRSRATQCRLLWGAGAASCPHDGYRQFNTKGNEYGNCGHKRNSPTKYNSCSASDALCGSLQCRRLDDKLHYGMTTDNSYRKTQYNFNNTIIYCAVVQIDLGLNQIDAGMVPDGAKCGENMMCLNQRCLSVAAVARQQRNFCPSKCSGHGICNSKGNCHCESGFAPPLCDLPGTGGSVDSGPANDLTDVLWKFKVAMYIIFLGVVPLGLLVLLGTHYWRHLATRRQRKPYVPSPSSRGHSGQNSRSRRIGLVTALFSKHSASMRRLLSFRRDTLTQTTPDTKTEEGHIYDTPIVNNTSVQTRNINKPEIKINNKNSKGELINSVNISKINKGDIGIVGSRNNKVRPPVKPKRVLNSLKESTPKMVIVNQGLTSTTNELVANISQIHELNKAKNTHLYENVRSNVKVYKNKK